MKNALSVLFVIFLVITASSIYTTSAQSDPVLYFCEEYGDNGEVGVSDRFTTGYLTVMVKCDYALGLTDAKIQFDQYNFKTRKFEYYKKFDYTVEPDMQYIFFSKNDESDMKFSEPGLYRVFLLDDDDETIASALIEIIE